MTTPDDPRPGSQEPSGDEAARMLEVGLDPASGPGRVPPPSPEEVGAWFPSLEILEILGQGGMGVVYKARQKSLDRVVALKVLPEGLSRDPAFAERFTREARALAKLQHPAIVGVHEFGEVEGRYFLVMEYVDGVNLRQLMDTRSLSAREALAIVPQICDALQYAHDNGVVHRDIKPENVLLDRRGNVKVADFGLAKMTQRGGADFTLTGTGQVMGTLHYMAPEQYKTPQDVDHRADIFSLGVVFYEMLTGDLPVGRFQKPSEAAELDARLDEIVMKALERERDLRYQAAQEVKQEVTTFGAAPTAPVPPPVPARAASSPSVAPPSGKRRFSRWALAAVLAIPIAALLGVLAYVGVEEIASGHGGWKKYYAVVAGFMTATVGFGIATLIAMIASIVTWRAKERVSGRGVAFACGVIALALIP